MVLLLMMVKLNILDIPFSSHRPAIGAKGNSNLPLVLLILELVLIMVKLMMLDRPFSGTQQCNNISSLKLGVIC